MNEREKIKDWYQETYPDDEVGETLNPTCTFEDLFTALDNYKDVYEVIGGDADSIVRERLFERLAEVMECDYSIIYDQWMKGENR